MATVILRTPLFTSLSSSNHPTQSQIQTQTRILLHLPQTLFPKFGISCFSSSSSSSRKRPEYIPNHIPDPSYVRIFDTTLRDGEHVACSVGTGPVDSAYKAVDLIVKEPVTLLEYSMNAVTEGIDAIATTRVVIRGVNNHTSTHALTGETVHRTFSGTGAGMDVVVSSVKAYIAALNKMLGFKETPTS